MKDLLFTPVLPWTALIIIAAALFVFIGWSFFYGLRSKPKILFLWTLRALAIVAFFALMLQPQRRWDEVRVLKPQLAVLVDGSESMSDPVDDQQPKRFERVKTWLNTPAMQKAQSDFDVHVLSFDDPTVKERGQDGGDLTFKGGRSSVVAALTSAAEKFRGQPLAGVLLLSDGLDTTGAAKAETINSPVPVFTFELEKPFKPKEIRKRISIANVDYPARVVAGWEAEVRVSLAGLGMTGQTVSMELLREGRKVNESAVAFTANEQTRDAAFSVTHEKSGVVQYELRVNDPATDKEAKSYPFLVEVVEPGNRIIYLQSALGPEFKFLRKAITTDRNLQLSAYVRWGDNKLVAIGEGGSRMRGATLDFTQKTLAAYAVVMLGDLPPDALTPLQLKAIRDFVDRGGALVLLGGGQMLASAQLWSTQLGALLPVKSNSGAEYREGKFPVEITQTGLHHPVFGPLFAQVKEFPPLLTANVASGVAPTAEVLIEANTGSSTIPMIVSMRFGQGRVVAVMTDTIWRWRLAAKGWTGDKSPYDTFWTQLMDWLIPKEKKDQNANRIELFTDRTNFLLGEKPEVRAIVSAQTEGAKVPATLPLQLRTPEDKVFEYTLRPATLQSSNGKQVPGFKIDVEPNVPGVYMAKTTATIGGASVSGETRFVVTRPVTELTGKPINRELLTRISESTRGKYYSMEHWEDWPKDLHYQQQTSSRMQLQDLWRHPLALAVLMGLLAAEWMARKLWSLP